MKPNVSKLLLSLYDETAKQKVLEILFLYPDREFSLSDLAKEAGIAKANIGKILEEFYQAHVIKIEKLAKIWRIRANQESSWFVKNKIIWNLSVLYRSGVIELLNQDFNNPRAIILFGSYRRGEDISNSDIDIAIELDTEQEYQAIAFKEQARLEKELHRKIQIHLFHRKKIDLNVFNNIANGIILSGFLEVQP